MLLPVHTTGLFHLEFPLTIPLTRLDQRLESLFGSLEALYARERAADADSATVELINAHRQLASAETSCTFYRVRLNSLTSGQWRVNDALLEELDRVLAFLEEAAEERDEFEAAFAQRVAALEAASPEMGLAETRKAALAAAVPRNVPYVTGLVAAAPAASATTRVSARR